MKFFLSNGRRISSKKPSEFKKKTAFGVGYTDGEVTSIKGKHLKSYIDWRNMLKRCYSNYKTGRVNTYEDCFVCEEWHSYKKFKVWHDKNHKDGLMLDKDVLMDGNKAYSPVFCTYISAETNLTYRRTVKAKGLTKKRGGWVVQMCIGGKSIRSKTIRDKSEANKVYLSMKIEKLIYLSEKETDIRVVSKIKSDIKKLKNTGLTTYEGDE